MLVFFFSLQKHCEGSCFFFHLTRWTSWDVARRPVRVVEQFWCSYPLKGPTDIFVFIRRPHEFAKPHNTHPRKARDVCLCVCVCVCVLWDGRCLLQICLMKIKTIKSAALKLKTAAETGEMPYLHCHFHTSWSAVCLVKLQLDLLWHVTLV